MIHLQSTGQSMRFYVFFYYQLLFVFIIASQNVDYASCFIIPVPSQSQHSLLKASSLRSRHLNQPWLRLHFSSSKVNDFRVRKVKTSHRTLLSSRNSEKSTIEPEITSPSNSELPFDGRYTFEILFYQSLIIVVSVAAAIFLNTPNFGLGENICLDVASVKFGTLAVVPLILLAIGLDLIEKYVPALQDVTTATQRSVLNLFGSKWKPFTALLVALAAGIIAGIGEEMLFRGIIQTWLSARLGVFMSISLSSLVFGALHAVTPMYAALTFIGSLYFGALYHVSPGNLVVPIVCHALYDVVVLMWAHYVVTSMTIEEQQKILNKTNTA